MGVTTEAELCNLALAHIGERQYLNSLDEASAQARACKVLYATNRDALLELIRWKFATRRSVLALTTEKRSGWAYAYALPADCLAPRFIYPGSRNPRSQLRVPFDVELSDSGNSMLLLTDWATPELVYTRKATNVAQFHATFVEALSWRLAVGLAMALPVKPQVARAFLEDGYKQAFDRAWAFNMGMGQEDELPDAEHIAVRGGLTTEG